MVSGGDGSKELIPHQEGPRSTSVITEVREATSLQKWLDGLEGAREQDQEVFAGRTMSHSYEVPEENVARDMRLDNSFLKAALPKLLDGIKDPMAIDHPLAYLIRAPGPRQGHPHFTPSSISAVESMKEAAKIAEKVETAINEGNLVALEALLQSRMDYLDTTTNTLAYREYVNKQVLGDKSMFGEPLTDSEKQGLDRARQEYPGLKKASDILKGKYGVDPTEFPTWTSVLRAPVEPNPTVLTAKAA